MRKKYLNSEKFSDIGVGKTFGVYRVYRQRRIRGFRATGETRHVPEVSWELGSKVPPTKKLKSLRLRPTIFREWPNFVCKKNQTSNLRGSMSGLNRIFTGEMSVLNRILTLAPLGSG